MQQQCTLKLLPSEANNPAIIKTLVASAIGKSPDQVNGYFITKKSIDARSRQPYINLTVNAFINEPFVDRPTEFITYKNLPLNCPRVIIVGAGPAGLFAALHLIEHGIQPVILERGKDVRSRRRDLARLNKEGIINDDSNYCFGEGGAGTYSDGKLYTRSTKRGNINRILNLFVQFGADEKILYESHPHIGTNKLPDIITQMRQAIINHGGIFLFGKKVTDLQIADNQLAAVNTGDGDTYRGEAVILCTGHSARDIFTLLNKKQILIELKPFALGVRIEHPQALIDSIQYGASNSINAVLLRDENLPPASYSLVNQVNNKGVFSFCMCPGGIIAPASTNANELVVNGWSPSKRNNPFANSGMVVTCEQSDVKNLPGFKNYLAQHDCNIDSPLALMYFQSMIEEAAYSAGGGYFVAPAQRMTDFCINKVSDTLPVNSYLPGLKSANLQQVLPPFIYTRLQKGLVQFGKKMPGYYTNEAVLVATESRTSSPVRIPRDAHTLQHPQIINLYPCGEGAGYAGGIVSAAMDGERVASMIAQKLGKLRKE